MQTISFKKLNGSDFLPSDVKLAFLFHVELQISVQLSAYFHRQYNLVQYHEVSLYRYPILQDDKKELCIIHVVLLEFLKVY
jgi:hypothetical protein